MKPLLPIALALALIVPAERVRSQSTEGFDMQAARAQEMTKRVLRVAYTKNFALSCLASPLP